MVVDSLGKGLGWDGKDGDRQWMQWGEPETRPRRLERTTE